MKIINVDYSIKNNKSILSAQIVLKNGKMHDIYFEVDSKFDDFVAKDASPFLAATLAICMKNNENLEIEGSISKKLMVQTGEIMKILNSWGLELNQISINPDVLKEDSGIAKNIGCFFSGGVDSFYTYLKNKNKINYLIFVHGFDINIKNIELYKKVEKNIIRIAKEDRIPLIKIKTNIRETLDQYFEWDLSHGFGVSSAALFLRYGFKEIYASCGLPNKNMDHHSMTPELDVLWSTENTKMIHYGCDADKIIKLNFLSNYTVAMENLRVCWVNKKKAYNCCECEKCFRNMLALYSSDSLEKCITFDKKLDLDKLKDMRVSEYCLKYFTAISEVLEAKNDKSEVRVALEEFIKNNKSPKIKQRLVGNTREFIRLLDKKYNRNRLYWFLTEKNLI